MFDVGFSELLVIGVIALMVVGPERLPKLARQAGFWVGRARRMVSDVKADIDREINRADLTKDFNEVKNVIHETKSEIESATTNVADTINKQSADIKQDVESIATDVSNAVDAVDNVDEKDGKNSDGTSSDRSSSKSQESIAATPSHDSANSTGSTS